MECFNSLLLKLREAHEREVEGKWISCERERERERIWDKAVMPGVSCKIILTRLVLGGFCLPGWQVKIQELSNKKGW